MRRFIKNLAVVAMGLVMTGAAWAGTLDNFKVVVVKAGDTLSKIAERELGDAHAWTKITDMSGKPFDEASARLIKPGDKVRVPAAPATSDGFASIVSKSSFDDLFPKPPRNPIYTYDALLKAADHFPRFCREGSQINRRREAAAFLAQIAHESGELKFVEEQSPPMKYREESNTEFPPALGLSYHGRGPMQLSWNYNYGAAGKALGLDLLSNPDRVKKDGSVAWMTALWFWMTPKPSCHAVMSGTWVPTKDDQASNRLPGFGMTTFIINGEQECCKPTPENVERRVTFYRTYCAVLKCDPGQNLFCDKMQNSK